MTYTITLVNTNTKVAEFLLFVWLFRAAALWLACLAMKLDYLDRFPAAHIFSVCFFFFLTF